MTRHPADAVPGPRVLTIATWNIGGGILGESNQRGAEPQLGHHLSVLREHAPDVVCLQEAHEYGGHRECQAEYLARHAGYRYAASFPVSESHLASGAVLALGILSRFPVRDAVYKEFPNPGLVAAGPDGTPWQSHDKGYVVTTIDLGDREFGLVNAHCFPWSRFGANPGEARFAPVWGMLSADLSAIRAVRPAFVAMDLNHNPVEDVLAHVLSPDGYISAFQKTATTPKGDQKDYILYDRAVRLLATTVAVTRSDHSYCQAKFLL